MTVTSVRVYEIRASGTVIIERGFVVPTGVVDRSCFKFTATMLKNTYTYNTQTHYSTVLFAGVRVHD